MHAIKTIVEYFDDLAMYDLNKTFFTQIKYAQRNLK